MPSDNTNNVSDLVESEPSKSANVGTGPGFLVKAFIAIGTLIIVAAFIVAMVMPAMLRAKYRRNEKIAIGTLLEIASLEEEFRSEHVYNHYGKFSELLRSKLISTTWSQDTLIDNYRIEWDITRKTLAADGGVVGNNTFTIAAFPKFSSSSGLHTFGIREDGVIRKFVFGSGMEEDVSSWPAVENLDNIPDVSLNPDN